MPLLEPPTASAPISEPPAAPAFLGPIAVAVDACIQELLDGEINRWTAIDTDLAAPLSALRELVLAGGKRLRPAFCHWAYVGAGGDPTNAHIVRVGAGLELLHTFALVHDDIMDNSRTRRGMDALHVQFVDEHRRRGWHSEDRRFGEGVAILIGDLAFVYADMLLIGVNPQANLIFNELRVEVNIGQYLDLLGAARGTPTVRQAKRICQYKSGKYTIERPLHLGAALADRFDAFETSLTGYGLPLGEAFQLRDDLLGALGNDVLTGKPVGDDLREGKPTALLATAIESASTSQLDVLAAVGTSNLTDEAVGRIQEVLRDTGAAVKLEKQIDMLRDDAISSIERSGLLPEAIEALVELANYVTYRDH